MFSQIRKEGIPTVTLDTGRIFGHNIPVREFSRQASLTHLEAMGMMGYQAVLLTVDEFRYGMDFLKQALATAKFTFVSCNLTWRKSGELLAKPYTIIEAGPMKVGVIGVSADQDYSVVFPVGNPKQDDNVLDVLQEVKVLDPFESVGRALQELDGKASPIIVLSSLKDEDNPKLARRFPQINVILTDVKLDDLIRKWYDRLPEEQRQRTPWPMYLREGDTYIVQASRTVLGQMIGRLDASFDQGKVASLQPLWLQLTEQTADDPAVRALVAKFYERVAKEENLQTPGKPIFGSNKVDSDPTNAYEGSSKCQACHAPQYEQWSKSQHADAYRALVRRVPQAHYMPACVICHTVGFGRPTGFTIALMQNDLRGVGCEVCHGPGKKHVAKPSKQNIRRTLTKQQCAECHTPEQMVGKPKTFDQLYPEYLERIKH